jgi:hypothetical protein
MREIVWQTYGETVIHPLALGFTLLMGALMFFLPRRHAMIPMLIAALFITEMQRVVVAGLDFNMIRILVLFGWARLFLRGELRGMKLNRIDKTIIWYALASIVTYTLLMKTSGALIYRLGTAFNTIGMFFLFGFLVRDFEDVIKMIKALAIISFFLAFAMLIEYATARNLFAVFGGVPEITMLREGRLRCQGAFAHPILAGSFGAGMLPLFIALWWQRPNSKFLAIIGIVSATIITWTSASSGPIGAYGAAILGMLLWHYRA